MAVVLKDSKWRKWRVLRHIRTLDIVTTCRGLVTTGFKDNYTITTIISTKRWQLLLVLSFSTLRSLHPPWNKASSSVRYTLKNMYSTWTPKITAHTTTLTHTRPYPSWPPWFRRKHPKISSSAARWWSARASVTTPLWQCQYKAIYKHMKNRPSITGNFSAPLPQELHERGGIGWVGVCWGRQRREREGRGEELVIMLQWMWLQATVF